MSLSKRGAVYHYDFMIRGKRYRGTTKERTEGRARKLESLLMKEALDGHLIDRKTPTLRDFAQRFLLWVEQSGLDPDTKRYYRNGWRLLQQSRLVGMRLSEISNDDVAALGPSSGSSYNVNNARRTLRRMLSKAVEWRLLQYAPKVRLEQEQERGVIFTKEEGDRLTSTAPQPLRDVAIAILDAGMRPEEVFRMRVEQVDWNRRIYTIPSGKTESACRPVPLSCRFCEVLARRRMGRTEGWIFPSRRSKTGHIVSVEKQWLTCREALGLDRRYVLYAGRHTFGTNVYSETGNLKLVMAVMGHKDVKTAMRYQHPEIELVREIIDRRNGLVDDAKE